MTTFERFIRMVDRLGDLEAALGLFDWRDMENAMRECLRARAAEGMRAFGSVGLLG
jgi:hypothetical protein